MTLLSAAIVEAIVIEYGTAEVLRRFSDPFWFQAFGCVLGFDWHSSGLTTTVTGALKVGLVERGPEMGLYIAGGKGGVSRKTPAEIETAVERHGLGVPVQKLVHASRMSAKVDSAALQDGFSLYHHVFIFTADGEWAVIQQGMQKQGRWARRYHWLGNRVTSFVEEPHTAVCCDLTVQALNLVAKPSAAARATLPALLGDDPGPLLADYRRLLQRIDDSGGDQDPVVLRYLALPESHPIPNARRLEQNLRRLYDVPAEDFETLLGTSGIGGQTIRALAMVAEIIHGVPSSFSDPVRYSFAHGGKDGHPYPVNLHNYRRSIDLLQAAVERARVQETDKLKALRRLAALSSRLEASRTGPVLAGDGSSRMTCPR